MMNSQKSILPNNNQPSLNIANVDYLITKEKGIIIRVFCYLPPTIQTIRFVTWGINEWISEPSKLRNGIDRGYLENYFVIKKIKHPSLKKASVFRVFFKLIYDNGLSIYSQDLIAKIPTWEKGEKPIPMPGSNPEKPQSMINMTGKALSKIKRNIRDLIDRFGKAFVDDYGKNPEFWNMLERMQTTFAELKARIH